MATNQSKRSSSLDARRTKQSAFNRQPSIPQPVRQPRASGNQQCFRFPRVKGQILDAVELWTYSEGHSISLQFKDKTCLEFSIDPGFTVKTDYSDWKTGNRRVIRKWPLIHSAPGWV